MSKLAAEGEPGDRLLASGLVMRFQPAEGAKRAVEALASNPSLDDNFEFRFGFGLNASGGPAALTAALKEKKLPSDVAKVAMRIVRSLGREENALVDALGRAGSVSTAPVVLSEAEMARLVADVPLLGDAARGETLFRSPNLQCLNCHAIAGAGGQVGPGLESIGASAPVDYLIDSLLQPNKAIKEGFHSLTVATNDGRVLTGIKVRDNEREVVLRDAQGKEMTIAPASIEEKKEAGSLMPAGLTETLTRQELADLVRFLSQLGKVGPYSVSKARLVRRWQVASGGGEDASWKPAYSRVDGKLPVEFLRDEASKARPVAARFQVFVTTPGMIRLKLSPHDLLEIRADRATFKPAGSIDLDLSAGEHDITLMLDASRRTDDLRCELEDVPGSPAKAQIVLGK